MIRTQIQLNEDHYRRLLVVARDQGVSVAEVVRSGVEFAITQHERRKKWDRAVALVGKYASGRKDVAQRHDRHLSKAFEK